MGPVAEYQKADAVAFGNAMGALVNGVRGDGVGPEDLGALIATMTSAASAMNEMKAVPEAAGEHIVSGLTATMGDDALAKALAEEQAAEAGGV